MTLEPIRTRRLTLTAKGLEQVRQEIERMEPAIRAQVSPAWLAMLDAAKPFDPWILGFDIALVASGAVIGSAGFKGPPQDGVVEIAYGIEPAHRGQGYATEAAAALTGFAFKSGEVRCARAHTLPEPNASTRVLIKCGFMHIGTVTDPDDGPVWRWESRLLPREV